MKKIVFYRKTLFYEGLTMTDRIVYSQILFRSLCDNNETTFDSDGEFNIADYFDYGNGYVPLGWTISLSISEVLKISERQLYRSLKSLKEKRLLTKDGIFIIDEVTSSFFSLNVKQGLSGWELIVYSYLAYKNKKHKWITVSHDILAKDLNLRRENFEHIISSLETKGYIKKDRDGRKGHLIPLRTTTPQK